MKINPKRNQELSEGLLEAARAVQTKSGEGDTMPIPDPDGPEYQAAVELESAANANLVPDNVPDDVTDAEFTELKEANALNAEFEAPTEETKQDKLRRIWFGKGEPRQDAEPVRLFALAAIEWKNICTTTGDEIKKLGATVRNLWIAAGNQTMTWYNTATIWAKTELETLQKAQAEFVATAEQAALYRKQERAAMRPVAKLEFRETMDYMNELWETKMRQDAEARKAANKRLTDIEASLRKLTRAANRAAPIKQETLDDLLSAVLSGKYVSAIKSYSEIVGCDIETAKNKLQELVPA